MHPRIAELLDYVDEQTAVLRTAYESVPLAARGTRPAPGRWSAAEIIHHLTIVEQRLARRLESLIEEARTLPPESEEGSVLERIDSERALDRTRRFVTSEMAEPHGTRPERVWPDYEQARRELLAVIATGDGLALSRVSAPHPALGTLTGYEWIAFVGSHAARHAAQIREMLGSDEPLA